MRLNTHPTPTVERGTKPGSGSIGALRSGALGSRLLRLANLAVAIHMAESARPRNSGAQEAPGAEGRR